MWYNDTTLFRSFGQALANADDDTDFVTFFSKPQKFNDAYDAWLECGSPTDESEDGWDEFVAAIAGE